MTNRQFYSGALTRLNLICVLATVTPCVLAQSTAVAPPLVVAGKRVEIAATKVTDRTVRIRIRPIDESGIAQPSRESPILVKRDWPEPVYVSRSRAPQWSREVQVGNLSLSVRPFPLTIRIEGPQADQRQEIQIDEASGSLSFTLGDRPIFGLGQGGPQFDRRGHAYPMVNNQSGYRLTTFSGRMAIPWLISPAGWAIFFQSPHGQIDLSGSPNPWAVDLDTAPVSTGSGRLVAKPGHEPLPLDFFVSMATPAELMTEYAVFTGFPSMPPLWAFGYQQSHRTLKDFEEVLGVARSFREKQLPCDALIYLGTGWCPSGWNRGHDSLDFNPEVFSKPAEQIRALKDLNFRVVLHSTYPPERLYGSVHDKPAEMDDQSTAHYWRRHLPAFRLGIDGWWPDAAEDLSIQSRLARIRMYWEGPQLERPNERPFALHRTGYAGMQRYGGWLWSGDNDGRWATLRNQLPIGLNTGVTGVPYWGTDIGGFYPTEEYTAEFFVRWFQLMSFSPLFRSHGRTWYTRLPWGWNTGVLGPDEMEDRRLDGRTPVRVSQLNNPTVEPILKKYLELRYRMLPYIYTAAREAKDTGVPMMRPLWLHYPDDPRAMSLDDQYLWGRDILVAPVFEKEAAARNVYLPEGEWYDFWTDDKLQGGRDITREVDLETTPLYVRVGSIIPTGPVKQHTAEQVHPPLTLSVYAGKDGEATMYEDDGTTFDFREGEFMKLQSIWDEEKKRLDLKLAPGSRLLGPSSRQIEVRLIPAGESRSIEFDGNPVSVEFQ